MAGAQVPTLPVGLGKRFTGEASAPQVLAKPWAIANRIPTDPVFTAGAQSVWADDMSSTIAKNAAGDSVTQEQLLLGVGMTGGTVCPARALDPMPRTARGSAHLLVWPLSIRVACDPSSDSILTTTSCLWSPSFQ